MALQAIQGYTLDTSINTIVTWEKFGKLATKLAKEIKSGEVNSYELIGIAPRGFFIADQISRIFDKSLAVICVDYDSNNQPTISNVSAVNKLGKNLLLINDIADSSPMLSKVVEHIKAKHPDAAIVTAAIWCKADAKMRPDIFIKLIDKEVSILQPFDLPLKCEYRHLPVPSFSMGQKDLHVTWTDYYNLVENLASEISKSNWTFHQVISIVRGGYWVGHPIAKVFNKPHSAICASSYREDHGKNQNQLLISNKIASTEKPAGNHWLIVDDLADTGETLEGLKRYFKENFPDSECKTAVLWKKDGSKSNPDFCAMRLPKVWIHQPFEDPAKLSLEQAT